MGKTTKEMNKALEMGQVTAKDLLPKLIPLMDEMSNKNGALAKQLQTAQTAQMRFNTAAQEGADIIWQGGMSEGMKDLFGTLSKLFKEHTPQLRKLGHVFGLVFKGLARALEILTPILSAVIDHMGTIFGAFMISKIGSFILMMTKLTTAFKVFGTVSAASWAIATAPIAAFVASLGLIDDWFAQFDRFKVNADEAERGYQIVDGKRVGIEQRDGKWYNTGKVQDAQGESYWLHKAMSSAFGDKPLTNNITVNIDGQEVARHTETRLLNGASAAPSR